MAIFLSIFNIFLLIFNYSYVCTIWPNLGGFLAIPSPAQNVVAWFEIWRNFYIINNLKFDIISWAFTLYITFKWGPWDLIPPLVLWAWRVKLSTSGTNSQRMAIIFTSRLPRWMGIKIDPRNRVHSPHRPFRCCPFRNKSSFNFISRPIFPLQILFFLIKF